MTVQNRIRDSRMLRRVIDSIAPSIAWPPLGGLADINPTHESGNGRAKPSLRNTPVGVVADRLSSIALIRAHGIRTKILENLLHLGPSLGIEVAILPCDLDALDMELKQPI
jgi:hypothetical protein